MQYPQSKSGLINRCLATLAKLINIKINHNDVYIRENAGAHYMSLSTGLDLLINSAAGLRTLLRMLDDSQQFVETVKGDSHANK